MVDRSACLALGCTTMRSFSPFVPVAVLLGECRVFTSGGVVGVRAIALLGADPSSTKVVPRKRFLRYVALL